MRGWSHEDIEAVLPRDTGEGSAIGAGARGGILLAVGGNRVDLAEVRLHVGDPPAMGATSRKGLGTA